ncbi:MAG TPA: exodeoxyribonuclease III [Candidatus Obscuribacterales bacterium]
MIIATWNVNSISVREPQVVEWIKANRPNVLCIQETKITDDKFPQAAFKQLGYNVEFCGEKTYNGVAIIADQPIECVLRGLPGEGQPQACRFIEAKVGGISVANVYIPNGQAVGSDKYAYKLRWLENLRQHLLNSHKPDERLVVLGDYNIAPEDIDVYNAIETAGTIMVSEEERQALSRIRDWGLTDTYRMHVKEGGNFSWWDYRMMAFRRNMGYRIDHIWATEPVARLSRRAWIDKATRKLERPSDHAPVVIEIADVLN